mgnify:CR=1 FL=1
MTHRQRESVFLVIKVGDHSAFFYIAARSTSVTMVLVLHRSPCPWIVRLLPSWRVQLWCLVRHSKVNLNDGIPTTMCVPGNCAQGATNCPRGRPDKDQTRPNEQTSERSNICKQPAMSSVARFQLVNVRQTSNVGRRSSLVVVELRSFQLPNFRTSNVVSCIVTERTQSFIHPRIYSL